MSDIVEGFVAASETEAPKLHKQLTKAGDSVREQLAAVLGRFDLDGTGTLDEGARDLAQRVLGLVHTPSAKGYELLLQVFDYMDINQNRSLEYTELTLAVEVLELFTRADSSNDTLSAKELEFLVAVLGNLDVDGNGVLDRDERRALRDQLWEPEAFLAAQRDKLGTK